LASCRQSRRDPWASSWTSSWTSSWPDFLTFSRKTKQTASELSLLKGSVICLHAALFLLHVAVKSGRVTIFPLVRDPERLGHRQHLTVEMAKEDVQKVSDLSATVVI